MMKKIISLVRVFYNNIIPFSVSFLAYFGIVIIRLFVCFLAYFGMAENIMLFIYIRLLLYGIKYIIRFLYPLYKCWSVLEGTYRTISHISQPNIRHKSLSVFVDTSLLCFNLWSVLCDNLCLFVSVYQFSLDFSSVSQNGE